MKQLYIDGRTSMYALAGQYIGFSPMTGLFNSISSFIGYNSVLMPFSTEKNGIEKTLNALQLLNFKGVFIDTPHRCEVEPLFTSISDEAVACGAVNAIRIDNEGFHGHNTEINAFRRAFPVITGEKLTDKKIFLIGSGGIARAIAVACAQEKCASLTIANHTAEKAQQLCDLVNSQFENLAVIADFNDANTIHSFYHADIIIHATIAGMFPSLVSYSIPAAYQFMSHHLVFDTVYNPPQTKIMQMADEKGCKFFNGRDMMFFACLEAFLWWTDVKTDTEGEKKLFQIWKEIL